MPKYSFEFNKQVVEAYLRRLRLEEEALLKKKRESSTVSEENTD